MKCNKVQERLSAWLDETLTKEEHAYVAQHLATCNSCQDKKQELAAIDDRLRSTFSAARTSADSVSDRVLETLRAQGELAVDAKSLPTSMSANRSPRADWKSLIAWKFISISLAAAAGFVLAMLTLPRNPTTSSSFPSSPPATFAMLRYATGPLQSAPSDGSAAFRVHHVPYFKTGTKFRSGTAKGELETAYRATIRFDVDTLAAMPASDAIELDTGRIWIDTRRADQKMHVRCGQTQIRVDQAICEITSAAGSEVEVLVLDGSANVESASWNGSVKTGQMCRFASGKLVASLENVDHLLTTQWIHDLLRRKDVDDVELGERVRQLWAQIGYTKIQHLYEDELRTLGSRCVVPLASFLSSEAKEHQNVSRRRRAAKLLGDLVDIETCYALIELLADSDGEVRFHIARGLQRATGQDMGLSPDDWRTAGRPRRQSAGARWQDWWISRMDSVRAKKSRNF